MRVAIITMLGGGFGFGFGNFLQVLGNVLEIKFNMWNVMEYSIGFFGGTAMAYGVFISKWPIEEEAPKKWVTRIAVIVTAVFFPLIVFKESLSVEDFTRRIGDVPNLESISVASFWFVTVIILAMIGIVYWKSQRNPSVKKDVLIVFFTMLTVYTLISYAITGLFAGKAHLNHHLYVVNIIVIYLLQRKEYPAISESVSDKISGMRWFMYFVVVVIVLAILSVIAINIHPGIGGAHNRFPIN